MILDSASSGGVRNFATSMAEPKERTWAKSCAEKKCPTPLEWSLGAYSRQVARNFCSKEGICLTSRGARIVNMAVAPPGRGSMTDGIGFRSRASAGQIWFGSLGCPTAVVVIGAVAIIVIRGRGGTVVNQAENLRTTPVQSV